MFLFGKAMEENALAVTESFFVSFEICGGLRKNLQTVKTILLSYDLPILAAHFLFNLILQKQNP